MIKINLSKEFQKVSRRYKNVDVAKIIDQGIALWGADLMVKEAKQQLDILVYEAPLPASAGPNYLDHARTRRTRNAVKRQRMRGGVPGNWRAFTAYVDKKIYDDYYYASILNYGGKPGGRMQNYKARPFWNNAAKIVQALFKRQGLKVVTEIKNELMRA